MRLYIKKEKAMLYISYETLYKGKKICFIFFMRLYKKEEKIMLYIGYETSNEGKKSYVLYWF